MGDLTRLALRRKLIKAEEDGDYERADRIRARMGISTDKPKPVKPTPAAPPVVVAGLDEVDFASPAARKAAEDAGLDATAFEGRERSSEFGFTKADVTAMTAKDAD
jgi:pyruvate/2-oxoglutarate dehydrogenase complex dihydrolipoamide acyltransferase (E2) component